MPSPLVAATQPKLWRRRPFDERDSPGRQEQTNRILISGRRERGASTTAHPTHGIVER